MSLYRLVRQSLASSRSYLCAYGTQNHYSGNSENYLHVIDRETGNITVIDHKLPKHIYPNFCSFSNDDELIIIWNNHDEVEYFPVRIIEKFGLGAQSDIDFPIGASIKIHGYSEVNNSIISVSYNDTYVHSDGVRQLDYDDQEVRNTSPRPKRTPPKIFDQDLYVRGRSLKISVNQFGEIAVMFWEKVHLSPTYVRIEIYGEVHNELVHRQTLFVADEENGHAPVGITADIDGSFLVLSHVSSDPQKRHVTVHRSTRMSSKNWQLQEVNSFALDGQEFLARDIFVAGGYIFVAGVTDRGARKPYPGFPDSNFLRYPFMHSFRRSDGLDTNLAFVNLHSDDDEEWSTALAFVDSNFIYIHGFIHGKPNLKRFQHDGTPALFLRNT